MPIPFPHTDISQRNFQCAYFSSPSSVRSQLLRSSTAPSSDCPCLVHKTDRAIRYLYVCLTTRVNLRVCRYTCAISRLDCQSSYSATSTSRNPRGDLPHTPCLAVQVLALRAETVHKNHTLHHLEIYTARTGTIRERVKWASNKKPLLRLSCEHNRLPETTRPISSWRQHELWNPASGGLTNVSLLIHNPGLEHVSCSRRAPRMPLPALFSPISTSTVTLHQPCLRMETLACASTHGKVFCFSLLALLSLPWHHLCAALGLTVL